MDQIMEEARLCQEKLEELKMAAVQVSAITTILFLTIMSHDQEWFCCLSGSTSEWHPPPARSLTAVGVVQREAAGLAQGEGRSPTTSEVCFHYISFEKKRNAPFPVFFWHLLHLYSFMAPLLLKERQYLHSFANYQIICLFKLWLLGSVLKRVRRPEKCRLPVSTGFAAASWHLFEVYDTSSLVRV